MDEEICAKRSTLASWLKVPPLVMTGFVIGAFMGLPAGAFNDNGLAGAGMFAAIAVVLVTWWASPRHRWLMATVVWLTGSWCAWALLHNYWVDQYDPAYPSATLAYLDHLPLHATLVGGAVAWLAVSAASGWRRRKARSTQLNASRAAIIRRN